MSSCTVLYPGLLGPDVPLDELPSSEWPDKKNLPNLSILLNRSQVERIDEFPLEHQVLSLLGYEINADDELPIARLRDASLVVEDGSLWCLDPVHVSLDREMAYLTATDELSLSEVEAQQLIGSLNQHFDDQLQIHYHNPHQWLATLALSVSTCTPSEAMQQDISRMMPVGEEASRWRSLSNEMQMLLHNHPVNELRQKQGKLPINSVWLWGSGELSVHIPDIDIVFANDAFVIQAAKANQLEIESSLSQLNEKNLGERNSLLVLTGQLSAIRRKDVYAWLADLQSLENNILTPLMGLLKHGKLQQLVIDTNGYRFKLTKKLMGKWWRRNTSLQTRMLSLRDSNDD